MKIKIIGLGLIGGSLARAIKKFTSHRVCGWDVSRAALSSALAENAIDEASEQAEADVTFICLPPDQTIAYILNTSLGGIVADVCGVKTDIAAAAERTSLDFVPCHPMAGKASGGFENSSADLWQGASFITCPTARTNPNSLHIIEELALSLGFKKITRSTPEEHDQIIAYTSQLAHIVSNCYLKSQTLSKVDGFFAGSFLDLTRVGRFDPSLWSELFVHNSQNLAAELENITKELLQYVNILKGENPAKAHEIRIVSNLPPLENITIS